MSPFALRFCHRVAIARIRFSYTLKPPSCHRTLTSRDHHGTNTSPTHARRSSVDLNDACINKQPRYPPSAMICCAATALCCAFAACCRARSAFTAACARFAVACNAATRCCSGVLGFTGFISERRIGYLANTLVSRSDCSKKPSVAIERNKNHQPLDRRALVPLCFSA